MTESFDDWMAKVDNELIDLCGLNSNDLPDRCYYDMYDNGDSPKDAASAALLSMA